MSQGTTKGSIAIVPTIDAIPTDGSSNPVSSNGVFDALALKQNIVSGVSDTEIGYLDGVTSAIQTQLDSKQKTVVADTTISSAVTGTVAETLCKTYTINSNTFSASDFMKFLIGVEKTGTAGTATIKIKVNSTNNFGTATQIATYTPSAASHVAILLQRQFFYFQSGNLKGINYSLSLQTDFGAGASLLFSSTSLSPSSSFYIFISITNSNTGDSSVVQQVNITN